MRKRGPAREIPPPLELECLRALWRNGQGSVKEIQERLSPRRPLAYTTVMTLLDRLAKRGFAERRKNGRAFVYGAVLDEARARDLAVRELADNWFNGSWAELHRYTQAAPAEPAAEPEEESSGAIDTALL